MQRSTIAFSLAKGIGLLFMLVGAALTVLLTRNYVTEKKQNTEAGLTYARTQADAVAKYIDDEMAAQKKLTLDLVTQLETASLTDENIQALLTKAIEKKPNLYGIGLGLAPNALPGQTRYATFYRLLDSGQRGFTRLDTLYDYTDIEVPTAIWYAKTYQDQHGAWYSYYGKAADDWIVVYAEPFYQVNPKTGKRVLAGVVAVAHSLNSTFSQFFQYIPLGQEGYAVLNDEDGKLVYHPKREFIGETIAQVAYQLKDNKLKAAAERLTTEKDFEVARVAANGFLTWTVFRELPSSGWATAVVVRQDVLAKPVKERVRELINIGLCAMLFLSGLVILVFRLERIINFATWGFSVSLGVILMLGIVWIWYLIYTHPIENGSVNAVVSEQRITERLAPIETSDLAKTRGAPIRIPTGVMIEGVTVTNKMATVSGYIWQKFPVDMDETTIKPPQFSNQIGRATLTESYRFVSNGQRVVGWFFNYEVAQSFNFRRYPLDEITVRLNLEPGNLAQNVVLVPDIYGYEYMSPSSKPGLAKDLRLPGWNIRTSYFTLEEDDYNADFGGMVKVFKNQYPSLVYNIHGIRNIASPLVAYCVVIYVLLVQIFGIVMLRIKEPLQVLSVGAAIFLVNSVTQNGLRVELASSQMVYLEYWFMLLYATILAASINGLARVLSIDLKMVTHRDNLLAQVLFWPVYLGIGFILTLATFYPW